MYNVRNTISFNRGKHYDDLESTPQYLLLNIGWKSIIVEKAGIDCVLFRMRHVVECLLILARRDDFTLRNDLRELT